MTKYMLFFLTMIFTNAHSQTNESELKVIKLELNRILFGQDLQYSSVLNQLKWNISNDTIYSLKNQKEQFVNVDIIFSDSLLYEQISFKCLLNSKKNKCLKIISNRKDFAHIDMLVNYLIIKKTRSCNSLIKDICTIIKMDYDSLLIPSYLSVIQNGEKKMFSISLISYGESNINIDLINHHHSYQNKECCKTFLFLKGVDIPFDRINNCLYSTNYLISIDPNKLIDKEYISHYD